MSIKIRNKENKTYVVIGCPHSATSFISKSLKDAGVDMNCNTKDVYQDRRVMYINNKILKEAGGWWSDPPSEESILSVESDIDHRIKNYIKKRKKRFWGFKDVRTALTGKRFLKYLEDDTYLICCFRKPEKVLDSLTNKQRKSKRDREVSRDMIDHYNKSIISIIKEFCGL